MEGLLVLVGLGVLAIPFIAFVLAMSLRGRVTVLEGRISELVGTLSKLEASLEEKISGLSGNVAPPRRPGRSKAKDNKTDSTSEELSASTPRTKDPVPQEGIAGSSGPGMEQGVEPGIETGEAGPWKNGARAIAPRKRRSAADMEKLIGERWTVILGGLAIALGAVFLVRYTIEAGLLGPRARIALGFVLSAGLFGAGEWLRRHDQKLNLPVFDKADIPGILTGVGSIAAFATLYAAYALYGFVGPGLAFVGLTVVGLATLALASIHGPKLAAIGVLGSYATPILVSTQTPNPMALTIHVLIVTACVLAMARLRGWLWLAFAGIIGATIWTMIAAGVTSPSAGLAGVILLVGLAICYLAAFAWQVEEQPNPPVDLPLQRAGLIAFSLLAAAFLIQLALNRELPEIAAGLTLAVIMTGTAIYWPALAPVCVVGGLVVIFTAAKIQLSLADFAGMTQPSDLARGLVPRDISGYLFSVALVAIPPAVFAIYGSWRASATARRLAGWLAGSACFMAFFVTLLAYMRIAPFETRIVFGAVALAVAAGFAVLTESFTGKRPDDMTAPAPAAFAVGTVSLLSFAIAVSFSKGWLPLGFALASLGIAYVYSKRPLAVVSWLSVVAAVLSGVALYFNAPFARFEIGSMPFFNALLTLIALPAAAILASGTILRKAGAEREGAACVSIGLAASGLFVAMEIRHWLTGGEIASSGMGLAEMATQSIAALGFAIGLQRLARHTSDTLFDKAALVAGGLGALMLSLGLLVVHNPLFSFESIGNGTVFNLLLPAFLIPGLMAALVALMARPIRPRWYTLCYAALAGFLIFAYASAMTRHVYQGEIISIYRATSDQEIWTYSAVWLLLGALVLAIGMKLRSLPVRAASGILIGLTICKVFLFDLSALTGALRAFSFLGLGTSLLIIGRIYQNLLRTKGESSPEDQDSTA
jgi:uncharacterized membrane protein